MVAPTDRHIPSWFTAILLAIVAFFLIKVLESIAADFKEDRGRIVDVEIDNTRQDGEIEDNTEEIERLRGK